MDFSPTTLRKHFADLTAKHDKIARVLDPARAELDKIVAGDTRLGLKAAREREAELRKIIVAQQAKLAPIEEERAAVARALGGKTGMASGDAAVEGFQVGDPIWFHDTDNPTDPDPAPGSVTAVNASDYNVEITLADESTRTEKHVGSIPPSDPVGNPEPGEQPTRWIERRDIEAGGPL